MTAEIFREQRPEVVNHFLEEYLHPQIDDGSIRVNDLFAQFDVISKAGFFYPVFLQEMDYLGHKVFGKTRNQDVVTEVNDLIEFLHTLSLRRVGDEETDLEFVKAYCRFAVVIVGKSIKLKKAIAPTAPYVRFIRNGLEKNVETVYLIGHAENENHIQQICMELSDKYDLVSGKKMLRILIVGEQKRNLHAFLAVLRAKDRQLYALPE